MADVPEEAIDAALAADVEWMRVSRSVVFRSCSRDQVRMMLEAAAPLIAAAERERIIQLATAHEATYRPEDPDLPGITGIPGLTKPGPDPLGDPFADLIREGP